MKSFFSEARAFSPTHSLAGTEGSPVAVNSTMSSYGPNHHSVHLPLNGGTQHHGAPCRSSILLCLMPERDGVCILRSVIVFTIEVESYSRNIGNDKLRRLFWGHSTLCFKVEVLMHKVAVDCWSLAGAIDWRDHPWPEMRLLAVFSP